MVSRRTATSRSKPRPPLRSHQPRRPRRHETRLAFETLTIEGGLLSPDWLPRVAALEAGNQSESDYRIPKGLQLRDEIGRYWRIAQAYWSDFAAGRTRGINSKTAQALSERFILALLRESFGFSSLSEAEPQVIAERYYPIGFSALGGRVPVIIAPTSDAGSGLDVLAPAFAEGGRRRSAFGLAQEYLNAAESATWGLASDGLVLRILRDNASLTRPAWIEADLLRIFTEERFADFAALWLLAHETRFGRADQASMECALETWRDAGREEGTRAREHLRRGVEEALIALGQGFLGNPTLRAALQDGSLSTTDYFQELLRLVYRLIFLLTVEERGLLHPENSSEAARQLYAVGYGLRRLRERSIRRSAHDRYSDLWESIKIIFRGLAAGEPRLALPALAGIFAPNQCPTLDTAKLENRDLLLAIFRLSWLREASGIARVNWRDMGSEELGSVYESLLELVPQITQGGWHFAFATGGETKGNARKTSGSFYTPDSLVQALLDSALEPIVTRTLATNPDRPAEALLDLSIVDPACGSGHFLLAVSRRLAGHVARFQANGTPSASEYRHALRQVVSRCLYGVDLNPLAVELCKVSLWMEAIEPGLPLTFLNSHIQHGNALFGTTPELMAKGIPDIAWDPIEGDDPKTASALKKRNKRAAGGQRSLHTLWSKPSEAEVHVVATAVAELDFASDSNPEALAQKESRWDSILSSTEYRHQKFVADSWCAAFVWPKKPGDLAECAPTNELWRQLRDGQGLPPELMKKTVIKLAEQYQFFHWHLQFPQVQANGGFDVVLGNPPWDTLSPDRREYFAKFQADIRSLSPADQDLVISRLLEDETVAWAWQSHQIELFGLVHFLKNSGRYTLYAPGNLGKGDFNVYRMFAELALKLARLGGYTAQVLPGGIYGGANASAIRQFLFDRCELQRLWGLINTSRGWFAHVDIDRFAAYSARRGGRTSTFLAQFGLTQPSDLSGEPVEFDADFIRMNGSDTYAIPDVRSLADLTVAQKMLDAHPTFGDVTGGPPIRHYQRELDMGSDRELFTTDPAGLPVYEGRMISHFDHRAKTYDSGHGNSSRWIERTFSDPEKAILPQWRVLPSKVPGKLGNRCSLYRIAFGDVANPRNERSLTAALVPPEVICGHKVPTITFEAPFEWAYLPWLAVANSFVMDWMARSKLSSPSMTYSVVDSLPFPRPRLNDLWVRIAAPQVLRLVCTSFEMTAFWNRMAAHGLCAAVPLGSIPVDALLDETARRKVRAELDALVARDVYGLTRAELADVLEAFPIVKKRDVKEHGEYRTKRMILEFYDAMAEAAHTGQPYTTRLDPPSAAPRITHPPRIGIVVSLPSRPSVLPSWGLELFSEVATRAQVGLGAGEWATSLSGMELGTAALAAVLRNLPGPRARENVEHAVVLALLPRLMLPRFDNMSSRTWRRVIGNENLDVASVGAFEIPWSVVLRKAIQQNILAELANGLWGAGPGVADAPSPELDARSLVVLSWLATEPAKDEEVTRQMERLYAA